MENYLLLFEECLFLFFKNNHKFFTFYIERVTEKDMNGP